MTEPYCPNLKRLLAAAFLLIQLSTGMAFAGAGEIRSKHFVVKYNTTQEFAKKVLNRAEAEYERITKNLGYARHDKYWTFESRCTVYVHANKESYLSARPGIPSWSSGYADYSTRTISGYEGAEKFVPTILPHEIAHLIFNDYVGRTSGIPKWFTEGVALAQEEGGRERFIQDVGKAIHQHYFIPIYLLSDEGFKGEHTYDFTNLSYAEAALLLNFLLKQYGDDPFVQFCRKLREGMDFEKAFELAYRGSLASPADLEAKFLENFQA